MYEELLIGLRGHAMRMGCDDRCPCYDAANRGYTTCSEELAEKAADAIEELSKRLDESIPKGDAEIIISEMAKPRWIPVTERLPDEPYGCLLIVWDSNPMGGDDFLNYLPYFAGWDGKQWNDGDGMQVPFEVVYWTPLLPLPEPPKEEQEETE